MPSPSPSPSPTPAEQRALRRLNTKDLAQAAQQRGYDDAITQDQQLYSATSTTNRRTSPSQAHPPARFAPSSSAMEQGQPAVEYTQSPISDTSRFDYPPSSSNLKSRAAGTTSPSLNRVRQRSPTGSSSASSSHGGFIGGAFSRASPSKRDVFGSAIRRPAQVIPRFLGMGGRSSLGSRGVRLSLLLLSVVGVYLWIQGGKQTIPRRKLTNRWWETNDPDDLAQLLPRPPMPPKPPSRPPLILSHSLSQLSRLPSTFSATSPPSWSAIIHLTSSSQSGDLPSLIPQLLKQSIAPKKILILAPRGVEPDLQSYGSNVLLLPYASNQPPALALLGAASTPSSPLMETDHLLFVPSSSSSSALASTLPPPLIKTLLRASATKEYSAALLATSGLTLPTSSSSSAICHAPSLSSTQAEESLTSRIHLPTSPFLLQPTWLLHPSLSPSGLRVDLPLPAALSLALYNKAGIPVFVLPVLPSGGGDNDCERLRRELGGAEEVRELGKWFAREMGGGGDLRARKKGLPLERAKGGAGGGGRAENGPIVFVVEGREEARMLEGVMCGLAEGTEEVRVLLLGEEDEMEHGSRCHLDFHALGSSPTQQSLASALSHLNPSILFHLLPSSPPSSPSPLLAALRSRQAIFGPKQGGRRTTKAMVEESGDRTVVVGLKRDEVEEGVVDWIAGLERGALRQWHTPRIDVSVLTMDRPRSLARLLNSLEDARYHDDDVSLSINLEQTADRATHRLVEEFDWHHGPISVRHRIVRGGLMPAVVESWYPTSNDSYGVFLEDDIEVSPLFYSWLKFTLLRYRYTSHTTSDDPSYPDPSAHLFGISLYQPKNLELLPIGRRPFDAHSLFSSLSLPPTTPYLSQVPCSWGAVYFPEVWREFHSYLALRLSEIALPISEPIVPDIKSNRWPRSWKKYFIELVYLRGYVMLYPNYADFYSLSTNHVEVGTHIKSNADLLKRQSLFEVPLLPSNASILHLLPYARLPSWPELPLLDFWGGVTTDEEVKERGWQTWSQLATCAPGVMSPEKELTFEARELLCKRVYERVERLVEAQPLKPLPRAPPPPPPLVNRPPIVAHPDNDLVDGIGAVGEGGRLGAQQDEGARIDRELELNVRRPVVGAIRRVGGGVGMEGAEMREPERVEVGGEEADIQLEDGEVNLDGEEEEGVETVEALPVGEEMYEEEGKEEWAQMVERSLTEDELLEDVI